VVIEAVFTDGRSIPLDLEQQVFTGTRNFIFHFTAPSFLSPEQIRFKYQLEGFDKEWIFLPPGKERVVNYRNLESGTYTFRVIACNSDGVWNRTGDSITFTLEPFFYETLIFKIAVLLVLAALGAAAVYFYKKRPGKEKSKEQEPAQKQEEKEEANKENDIKYKGSSLNPIFADECMKKLKYLMTVEKVYCDTEISLQSLAKKISITPHQLSQLINERLDRNFSDFINYHRIEEIKMILESTDEGEESITDAAHQVGFNSLTAFYNSFKKYTQMTPSQYKKEAKKKKS
jgi:AraC-like DNA-binding protein